MDDCRKAFLKAFNELAHTHHNWCVWSDFVTMLACSISNSLDKNNYEHREKLYMDTISSYDKPEQKLFPELAAHTVMALEKNPEQDFLGSLFMELNLGDHWKQQVFTPYDVCQLMSDITAEDISKQVNNSGIVTFNDSACGAGATLIAAINKARLQLTEEHLNFQNHVLITAQDIDFTAAMMCYIQISLLGAAGYVKVGNSLTDPMTPNDDTENYWFTPMYFSDVWVTRRLLRNL